MDERSADAELWREGVGLFNQRRFFECHEVWERLWKRSGGAEKVFYQGMIQAAAALLHVERGQLAGARSTWAKARAKLDAFPPAHHGIALGELRVAVGGFIAAALDGRRPPPWPRINPSAGPLR